MDDVDLCFFVLGIHRRPNTYSAVYWRYAITVYVKSHEKIEGKYWRCEGIDVMMVLRTVPLYFQRREMLTSNSVWTCSQSRRFWVPRRHGNYRLRQCCCSQTKCDVWFMLYSTEYRTVVHLRSDKNTMDAVTYKVICNLNKSKICIVS